jgi:type II secretory pathway component PulF
MPNFQYQAVNDQREMIVGQIQADSVPQAVALLEARGLVVQSIGYVPAPIAAELADPAAAENPEQGALQIHMTRLLQRSAEMVSALRAFAQELPPSKRRQLDRAIAILERGDAAAATADLTRLPEFWVPLLSASAASNDPGRILSQFLEEAERASELRRQWFRTLAYPALLIVLACAVLVLLSVLVIPMYRQMFEEFDLRLPPVTLFILKLSSAINSGELLIGIVVALVVGYLLYRARLGLPEPWRIWWNDTFGTLLGRSTAVARLATFGADLMQAGLPTPAALRIAGHCAQSPRLQRAAWRLARDVERNEALPLLRRSTSLPQSVIFALRGEIHEAARIRLLREVGQCYAQWADLRLSWKHGLIEPLAVIIVGLLVGLTLVALFLPVLMLIQGLSGGLA